MIKRMTLLAKKEGSSISDFRAYWAGCHAELALCMDGITSYTQNRVEKRLWQCSNGSGQFTVDGVVELCFESDEAMSRAQHSRVGSEYIPQDEPNFLYGWTLCVVTPEDEPRERLGVKVLVLATTKDECSRVDFKEAVVKANALSATHAEVTFNWTERSAKRDRLWAEPVAPNVLLAMWFGNTAQAHDAFRADGELASQISRLSTQASAYLINALIKR
ncbi:EthD protein [Caballeronia arationis]|uniref:Methylmuconolactone methyl-isomerase n=2 Tax=Caballeronia arationis TaxID=1777142 RepID=A0A7Z7IF19_9BURK|nr:EthD domain-containing protein [Caballeronia arationis]SAL04805.1 EthD protein [Caballeronia arationis]SOE91404.1 Methylmuconolactone methyl-isomerase [Caballeronia arationis]